MGNKYLAEAIKDATGVSGRVANDAAGAVVEAIVKALKREGSLNVLGFGTFRVVRRAAHKGRNPATGEAVKVKASKAVRFKASMRLKSRVK